MCKCRFLVVSLQLANNWSDVVRNTIIAHNAGKITKGEIKFHDGNQKGLEQFVAKQEPEYIFMDDTGRLTRKLINKIKHVAGTAKFIHVGYNEVTNVDSLHRQFPNWEFKFENLTGPVLTPAPRRLVLAAAD